MRLTYKLFILFASFALSANAPGAIIYFANQNIPIPTGFAGVSVDLEDPGTASNAIGGLPDGDVNFFFGGAELSNDADAGAASPSWQPVRTAPGSNTIAAANMTPFVDTVDASNTYATGFGSSGDITSHFPPFTPGVPGYIGFSMIPNAGGPVVYGWVEVTLQNDGVTPGIIHAWAYESDPGVGILVGIPEPGSATLAIFGLAACALRRRRRA